MAFPKSPAETVGGMRYFARMLDKIRMQARGELGPGYQRSLGAAQAADGACTNFLRVSYDELRERVLAGGTDEEIMEWCFSKGRRLNEGDLFIWNSFVSKLGWNDVATPNLEAGKKELGISDRTDIQTMGDLIDFEEKRKQ